MYLFLSFNWVLSIKITILSFHKLGIVIFRTKLLKALKNHRQQIHIDYGYKNSCLEEK